MSTDSLSAPGTSTYSSNTMYVGDGTWDSERNTFLLPNLMGLNFDTMRYNGMGNRFKEMSGYKAIIMGHGIVAAFTFLAIVPAAIFLARFYHRNPHAALVWHIRLQILTVILTTVVFTLGWFAVGPARSLTNPHHGIGLALYVLVLVQAIGGGLIHFLEKGRERYKIPLKLFIHQWLGRAVAILGFIQIALGLTLWGSPKVLFILYAIWGFVLLMVYFVFTYRNLSTGPFIDDGGTYVSDYRSELTEDRRSGRRHRRLVPLAAVGAAGAGLAAMRRRSRSRRRSRETGDRTTVLDSRPTSRHESSHHRYDSYADEKFTEDGRDHRDHTWRDRLLGAGAGIGLLAALKGLFNKGKRDRESEVSGYSRPTGGTHTVTQTDLSRVEEGRAPASPETPRNDRYRRNLESEITPGQIVTESAVTGSPIRRSHLNRRRSGGSVSSWDSRDSFESERDDYPPTPMHDEGHGLRNSIATLGFVGFLKHKFGQRKARKEDERVEEIRQQEFENERVARANSQRRKFTGDGMTPLRKHGRVVSEDSSALDYEGSNPELARHGFSRPHPPTIPTGDIPPLSSRIDVVGEGSHPATGLPPPPHDPLPMPHGPGLARRDSSGSEAYMSPGGRQHHRHHLGRDAAMLGAGAAAGAAAGGASSRHGRRPSADTDITSHTPVSVKVKMHNDGRHVTLRRLNEAEAAAEREARKRDRGSRKRTGSLSSVSGDERWRRTEEREAAEAAELQRQHQQPPPPPPPQQQQHPFSPVTSQHTVTQSPQTTIRSPPILSPPSHPLPAPPSVPSHGMSTSKLDLHDMTPIPGSGLGSGIGSPSGTYTETEASNYDNNRRRRRAERAQARLARGGGGSGSRVEFT